MKSTKHFNGKCVIYFYVDRRSYTFMPHLLRIVFEPEYYTEEVIGHPNHHWRI